MTDPVYGNTPLDPAQRWDDVWLRPLYTDPYWKAWRDVWASAMDEYNQSQWLTRWRRSVTTAEGQQLIDRGIELNFAPKPAGWTDERYRDVLVAIYPGIWAMPTPAVLAGIAAALIVAPQTAVAREEFPLSTRVTFTDTSVDEAITYITVLDRGRPNGAQIFVVAHPDALTTFTIGTSTIGGAHTLGTIAVTP